MDLIYQLLFIVSFLCALSINGDTIILSSLHDITQLETMVKEPFIVTHCQFTTDMLLTAEEFYYLTEIKVGNEITSQQLMRAMVHLLQKNCFESIELSLEDDYPGKKLSFAITGVWRFEKIKVSGIWVGRDWYKQYYLMEPGDPFDLDKHNHSLQKIGEACKKEGFFDVKLQSTFDRNPATKTVTVRMTIDRGRRFSIENSLLNLYAEEQMPYAEVATLKRYLYKKYLKPSRIGQYSRTVLEQLAKGIKDYLAQRGFLLVTIDLTEQLLPTNKEVRLIWEITLGKQRNFVFFGARFFSHKQLLNRLLQFGRSAWLVPASILAEELKDMYYAKGFWQTKIDTNDNENRSLFVITEGKRALIKTIEIEGVNHLSPTLIMKHCCNKMMKHRFFDQQLAEDAYEKIVDYYGIHGFPEAKIVEHEFKSLDDETFTWVITIDEGIELWANTVTIEGYEHLLVQYPFYRTHKKDIRYNALHIQEQKRWLIDYFRDQGYLFATITMDIIDIPDGKKHLVWHVDLKERILFGKTVIQGSTTFPFTSLMRELHYKEGDVWNPQKIRKSFLRLKDKHIFDSVSLAPFSMAADKTERPIMLKLHKDDPFEVRLRAGLEFQHIRQYQTFGGLTYKIGGTFLVKNPSNHGDYFRFDGDVARSHREIQLTYFYPWIFNVPIGGLFQAYAIRYEQPGFVGNKNDIYTIFQEGARVGLQHKQPHLDTNINIGFEVDRTKVGNHESACAFAQAICFDACLLDKQIPFFYFEPTLLMDHIDNNLNPHKGMLTLISLKGMFPTQSRYADSYFFKLLVEHTWFIPLQKVVAAFRVRFGHIFHRCFSNILPSERFYLGGSHSVRSYEADLAPPLGCFIDKHGKKNLVPRGGKTMLNVNIELRLPEFKKIGIVLFSDMGILSGDDFIEFEGKNMVGGTGFGIRFFTPIGPLRFDVAWKWKTEMSHERRFNWYLTFGQAF